MKVRGLGLRTDVMIVGWHADIEYAEDHIVVRTASNPSYHWGNFVIFDRPPRQGDYETWLGLFDQKISSKQDTRHVLLIWDGAHEEGGDASEFIARGFEIEENVVLSTKSLQPPSRPNTRAIIRPLVSDSDWAQATENQIRCREERYTEANYRDFKVPQMRNYRMLSEQGRGDWYGAFYGDELVADLGIYRDGELARYQSVGTHPDYRCQGLCGTLVYEAGRDVMRRHGVTDLVMVAEPEARPSRIYQSVGFAITEKNSALYRRDPDGRS